MSHCGEDLDEIIESSSIKKEFGSLQRIQKLEDRSHSQLLEQYKKITSTSDITEGKRTIGKHLSPKLNLQATDQLENDLNSSTITPNDTQQRKMLEKVTGAIQTNFSKFKELLLQNKLKASVQEQRGKDNIAFRTLDETNYLRSHL